MSQKILHCSSSHCIRLVIKLNLKSAHLQGKLHISKKCITSSKNAKKCIASRNLTTIAYLKYFQTQFKTIKSAHRQILHNSSVHSSRVYCSTCSNCFRKDSNCFDSAIVGDSAPAPLLVFLSNLF